MLGNEQLAVRWHSYGLYIRATVLQSPKGLCGIQWERVSDQLCKTPTKVSPPGVACGAEGGTADFRTTTTGAAQTSPPEGVFRHILRKKYYDRRAVGTHYGPTLILQAGFSLCRWRDCRAVTKILQLVSIPDVRTKSLGTMCRQNYRSKGNATASAGSAGSLNETTSRRK